MTIIKCISSLTLILLLLLGCSEPAEFTVVIENNDSEYDSLFIVETITGRSIAKISLKDVDADFKFRLDEPTQASLALSGSSERYLVVKFHKVVVQQLAY